MQVARYYAVTVYMYFIQYKQYDNENVPHYRIDVFRPKPRQELIGIMLIFDMISLHKTVRAII